MYIQVQTSTDQLKNSHTFESLILLIINIGLMKFLFYSCCDVRDIYEEISVQFGI